MAIDPGCVHAIQFVLKSVGHMGMGISMQQDDAISEFSRCLFLILVHSFWSVSQQWFALSPFHFHMLGSLKKVLKGHMPTLDDNMQEAVVQWFWQQPKDFYADGICLLVNEWNSCLNACGNFFNCYYNFIYEHSEMGFI
jgi:hypothetical protein